MWEARLPMVMPSRPSSPEKIREDAARSGMHATDIYEVADTVVIRPDPVAAAA
jgi:hypothetical protein